jgi:hypothetical protein
MPKAVEDALRKAGMKKGLTGDALANFVYGTMTVMMKRKGMDMHGKPLKK